jgi:hypothetical protein
MGFRLDYFSCILTILSTALVGRRMWQGWIVASANSAVICVIAFRTAQLGFVPANLFCLAIYGYNIAKWRPHVEATPGRSSEKKAARELRSPHPLFKAWLFH